MQVPSVAEARLQIILDSEPECVKTVSQDGCLLAMNPAGLEMIGVSSIDEVRGTHLSKIVNPDHWRDYEQGVEAVFRGEKVTQQFQITSLDGTVRWMEQTAAPIYDPANPSVVTEMVAVTRDISNKKETELNLIMAKQAAEAANEAKTAFLANMSHEIRTPMNGILGMVHILAETQLTEEQAEWVAVIQESGESLLRILNDILDISKVEAGHLELEQLKFKISDQMAKLERLHAANAEAKGISLNVLGCDHIADTRRGDPTRLSQLLNNLIENAIKFTPQGEITGEFLCSDCANIEQSADHIQIRIKDTGIGMTPEQMERIFEPFTQADAGTTRRYGGTGLGLTIVKSLTELLGGSVQASSSLGEGTTFEITLPLPAILDQGVDRQTLADPDDGQMLHEQRTVRLLAVEDSKINQMVLRQSIKKINCELVMVDNGAEAIDQFSRTEFDLVLMDIHMPVMDGIEALAEIRRIEAENNQPETPVVAFTASVTSTEIKEYQKLGFSQCLPKPTQMDALRNLIESIQKPDNPAKKSA